MRRQRSATSGPTGWATACLPDRVGLKLIFLVVSRAVSVLGLSNELTPPDDRAAEYEDFYNSHQPHRVPRPATPLQPLPDRASPTQSFQGPTAMSPRGSPHPRISPGRPCFPHPQGGPQASSRNSMPYPITAASSIRHDCTRAFTVSRWLMGREPGEAAQTAQRSSSSIMSRR